MFALRSMAAGSFLLKGLLKKSRLLRRPAPIELRPTPNWCWTARNDTKGIFQVIASDSKNQAAISKLCSWTFSTDPLRGNDKGDGNAKCMS